LLFLSFHGYYACAYLHTTTVTIMPTKKLPFANVENRALAVKAPASIAISPRKKQVKNTIDDIFTGELFALFPSRNQYRVEREPCHGSKARFSSMLNQHATDTFELAAHSTGHGSQCLL
jgi:hypothetical protein